MWQGDPYEDEREIRGTCQGSGHPRPLGQESRDIGQFIDDDGLYYLIGSYMTGWTPNPNQYATASRLEGPWSKFTDIAPPETKTYGCQSTMLLKVVGSKKTTVIFMGDLWKPRTQWDSRHLWMPLEIGSGKLWLPEPKGSTRYEMHNDIKLVGKRFECALPANSIQTFEVKTVTKP